MAERLRAGDLPQLRGIYTEDAALAPLTWFRVGGPAEILFQPADPDDLSEFIKRLDPAIPRRVVGVGSNLLIRDGGLPGVTIRLGRGFTGIDVEGTRLRAGAGVIDVALAKAAQRAALSGLEFFRGIPGAVGGALRMNAGAYGSETQNVLVSCRGIDSSGSLIELAAQEMGFAYRHSSVPDDFVFVEALFQGQPGDPDQIAARMQEITASREATQPVKSRTGGSTFKNPDPDISGGRKAWQLIDAAGCRGLRRGGAQVSELHCNFLLNHGEATAEDLEGLGEEVRRRVLETTGVALEWEIKRLGQRAGERPD